MGHLRHTSSGLIRIVKVQISTHDSLVSPISNIIRGQCLGPCFLFFSFFSFLCFLVKSQEDILNLHSPASLCTHRRIASIRHSCGYLNILGNKPWEILQNKANIAFHGIAPSAWHCSLSAHHSARSPSGLNLIFQWPRPLSRPSDRQPITYPATVLLIWAKRGRT